MTMSVGRGLDLLSDGRDRLTSIERAQIKFIRRTFEPGLLNTAIRWCQRSFGATWIHHCTKHLRAIHGAERLPAFDLGESYVCVSNHRSFFDLYVVTAELVRRGLSHRIAFPVRSTFFYDSVTGFFVNGVMSFFAMYPPIFREREKLSLNVSSLHELSALLKQGGVFAGLHPEGTRGVGPDPYTLLSAQPGVGRVIFDAKVPVIPVFVNGLINDLRRQVASNFDRTGQRINVVFGQPIDFGELLDGKGSPRRYRAIAERTLEEIGKLGAEERELRAQSER